MSEVRSTTSTILAVALLVAGGAYFLWPKTEVSPEAAEPSPPTEGIEELEPTQKRPPVPGVRDEQNVHGKIKQARGVESQAQPVVVEDHATRPPCQNDTECRGARTADCVQVSCQQGVCLYDESTCGCTNSEQCDDDDPCTRNHCFARTKECIFIPQDCER